MVGAEDVVQSVFRSFFRRQGAGEFEFDGWGGVWALLVKITSRKINRRSNSFHCERRNIKRELTRKQHADELPWEFPAREPTPADVACLEDTIHQLMESLTAEQRYVVVLRLQLYSVQEIAVKIGKSERTVQRILVRVKEGLQKLDRSLIA